VVNIIYDLLYMIPLYFLSLMLGGTYLGIDKINFFTVIISLFFIGMLLFAFYARKFIKVVSPVVLFAFFATAILIHKSSERPAFILDNLWVFWLLVLAVIIFIIGKISQNRPLFRYLLSAIIVVGAGLLLWFHIEISKFFTALLFFQLLIYLLEEIQRGWVKADFTENKFHLVCVAPFALAICLIVFASPVKDDPYDWQFFKNIWVKVSDTAKRISQELKNEEEEYGEMGFSEKAQMGLKLLENPKDLLVISADRQADSILYLAGRSFDTFSEGSWITVNDQPSSDKMLDVIESRCAVNSYDSGSVSDYLRAHDLRIRYLTFSTRYLFAPSKSQVSQESLKETGFTEYTNSICSDKTNHYGESFTIRYNSLNSNDSLFGDFVSSGSSFSEEDWNKCLSAYEKKFTAGCTYEDYLKYQERIKNDYCEEVVLSDEAKQLLNEIYSEDDDPFVKMKKFESWIRDFEYTTQVESLPADVLTSGDFLDYFLLDKKEGYCVYFATAMALVARAEGLPSRLTQGFYVYRGSLPEITVSSDMTHAWSEIYFDGIGWISFEPTPTYGSGYGWTSGGSGSGSYYGPSAATTSPEVLDTSDESFDEMMNRGGSSVSFNIKIITIPLCIVLILFVIFLLIFRIITVKKLASLSDRARLLLHCRFNILLLSKLGYELNYGETLEEFGERVICTMTDCSDEMVSDAKALPLDFITCYEEMLYSVGDLDIGSITCMERIILDNKKALINLLKKKNKALIPIRLFVLSFKFALMV